MNNVSLHILCEAIPSQKQRLYFLSHNKSIHYTNINIPKVPNNHILPFEIFMMGGRFPDFKDVNYKIKIYKTS